MPLASSCRFLSTSGLLVSLLSEYSTLPVLVVLWWPRGRSSLALPITVSLDMLSLLGLRSMFFSLMGSSPSTGFSDSCSTGVGSSPTKGSSKTCTSSCASVPRVLGRSGERMRGLRVDPLKPNPLMSPMDLGLRSNEARGLGAAK
jgi:hypothetical protein